jgi:2-oxoglutarate ferredoxin oxidoreductase subunit delta
MANTPPKVKGGKAAHRVKAIVINHQWCKGCELCVDVCPRPGVLEVSDQVNTKGYRRIQVVDLTKCTGCGMCEIMCPDIAITIKMT